MDNYERLRQEIRKAYGYYIGRKSLTSLNAFMDGCAFGRAMSEWERSTGLNPFEHIEEVRTCPNLHNGDYSCNDNFEDEFFGFLEFVHEHYNVDSLMTAHSGDSLISEKSSSEEEAFDKYFELQDAFQAHKNSPDYVPISKRPLDISDFLHDGYSSIEYTKEEALAKELEWEEAYQAYKNSPDYVPDNGEPIDFSKIFADILADYDNGKNSD
ncbi:MAG: hypothetical protein FWG87_09155 [Defluviitaleaceae bacterium]|nr:hypothetical protein [Defluviitaleaceae bacterium]